MPAAVVTAITPEALQSAAPNDAARMVKRRHPDYASNSGALGVPGAVLQGRPRLDRRQHLHLPQGRSEEFAKRKERAYRFPHSREVVSLVNKYVFKGAIERRDEDKLPAEVKDFWKSSTLLKRPIADLMSTISTWTSTFGRIWIVVDNNVPRERSLKPSARQSGGRCYAYFPEAGRRARSRLRRGRRARMAAQPRVLPRRRLEPADGRRPLVALPPVDQGLLDPDHRHQGLRRRTRKPRWASKPNTTSASCRSSPATTSTARSSTRASA
jgi:hypothetical protein